MANAASASGNWEQAREHCVLAHEAGASETDVLFCLGRVALGSATPSPTAVGLALEDRVKTPEAILLAGFLLAMDNRFGKARSLFEDAPAGISPVYEAQIQLTLGDARYMTGDSAGAAEAWGARAPAMTHARGHQYSYCCGRGHAHAVPAPAHSARCARRWLRTRELRSQRTSRSTWR